MTEHEKISTGANDRPRDASIAQSADGLPDDSGNILTVDDAEVDAVRRKLGADQAEGSSSQTAGTADAEPRAALKRQVEEEIKASERGSE